MKSLEQPYEPYLALGFLILVALFISFKAYKEHILINKAALALGIPQRLTGFFRVDLMSIYNHLPALKSQFIYGSTFLGYVQEEDEAHYQCIMDKLKRLLAKEEEYGEAFVDDLFYGHNV